MATPELAARATLPDSTGPPSYNLERRCGRDLGWQGLAMKHRFFTSDRPRVFAHRGGAGLAPENTIAAFDNGLALGADGLELDVHLSRDGVVVVHHDSVLERTTDLHGPVGERTAAELARADAGWNFGAADAFPFRGRGIGVPTLAEVLSRYRDVPLIIELKESGEALARAVVDLIHQADAAHRVCVGAFDIRGLRIVRHVAPAIATSAAANEVRWAVCRCWCRWPVSRPSYDGYQVPESAGSTRIVSPSFIAGARRAGLGVQVWTVDAAEQASRLLAWGVDALISDRPDVTVPIVKAYPKP